MEQIFSHPPTSMSLRPFFQELDPLMDLRANTKTAFTSTVFTARGSLTQTITPCNPPEVPFLPISKALQKCCRAGRSGRSSQHPFPERSFVQASCQDITTNHRSYISKSTYGLDNIRQEKRHHSRIIQHPVNVHWLVDEEAQSKSARTRKTSSP